MGEIISSLMGLRIAIWHVYFVARDAITKYHRLSSLNSRKLCYPIEFSVDHYKESRGGPSH